MREVWCCSAPQVLQSLPHGLEGRETEPVQVHYSTLCYSTLHYVTALHYKTNFTLQVREVCDKCGVVLLLPYICTWALPGPYLCHYIPVPGPYLWSYLDLTCDFLWYFVIFCGINIGICTCVLFDPITHGLSINGRLEHYTRRVDVSRAPSSRGMLIYRRSQN